MSLEQHERILWPGEYPRMHIKLVDSIKLRPKEWSILWHLLSQFPNGHLSDAFYKCISLWLLNVKVHQLTDLTDPISTPDDFCSQRIPWLLVSSPINIDPQLLRNIDTYVTALYSLKTDCMSRFACQALKPRSK